MISVYLQMFCIPQVENGTQRWAANQTDCEQQKRSRRAGASSVAVRQPPSDLNQKLRSLSPSLGRYHELRRDRGRWVEYVREAGGINGANFQERYRGGKRGQPPGELKERRVTVRRRRRHCVREIHSWRTSGNDLSFLLLSRTLENVVYFGVT